MVKKTKRFLFPTEVEEDLYLEEDYKKDYQIGKYGHLRLQYLKEHKKAEYSIMLLDGTLRKHIVDTDIQAKEKLEIFIRLNLQQLLLCFPAS